MLARCTPQHNSGWYPAGFPLAPAGRRRNVRTMFARSITLAFAVLLAAPALAQQAGQAAGGATPPAAPAPAAAPDPAALAAARLAAPTPIGEIPQASFVMIMGTVVAANMADFVLSDGHASVVVDAGHGWASKSAIRVGDRIRVIGRMDAYGSGRFVGGLVTRADGKTTALQPLD